MEKISVVSNRQKIDICTNKIMYIERKDRKIELVCGDNIYKVNDSLENLLKFLPSQYVRCHTGYIVNLDKISAIHTKYILLEDGTIIPIGRAYKINLKKAFVV